ncbi:MAG TPA: class I SAM-dependent methyltransferase family protein [Methanothermococcus okinawensis]|uniref:tRNA (guanine(37)-N(1))-methyltransferase n=1 Tax=Methanothermococcus okinawensis TaxID=155863 RepID=A0A832YRD9_9EURY|nr:class I SAM-dependent methyltransferase family protein [Methanothermococcus okinawensis]
MHCLKVNIKEGEKLRRYLLDRELLNREYKLKREDNYLYLPIKSKFDNKVKKEINTLFNNVELLELEDREFSSRYPKKQMNFREYLIKNFKREIEEGKISLSYDIIGKIAIIQISDGIDKCLREEIGINALKLIPSIESVFRRKSNIEGIYRTRKLELLAGKYDTLTLYKENGYRLWVDVEKVYFSPRLGWERKRIMERVNSEDVVIDMFCGVGPFSMACKNAKKIYSIDINPNAIDLLKRNILLNKLQNKIIPILGDVRDVEVIGNRVIMNLPMYSHLFIDKALSMVEDNGIIHYYTIGKDFNNAMNLFQSKCDCQVIERRIVKSYSSREYVLVLDIKVNKI